MERIKKRPADLDKIPSLKNCITTETSTYLTLMSLIVCEEVTHISNKKK